MKMRITDIPRFTIGEGSVFFSFNPPSDLLRNLDGNRSKSRILIELKTDQCIHFVAVLCVSVNFLRLAFRQE